MRSKRARTTCTSYTGSPEAAELDGASACASVVINGTRPKQLDGCSVLDGEPLAKPGGMANRLPTHYWALDASDLATQLGSGPTGLYVAATELQKKWFYRAA